MQLYKVFVYGTLLVGEENHYVAQPYIEYVEKGTIEGLLYNVGDYPAVVLVDGGMEIKGEWFTVNQKGLEQMDWLEDYTENGSENEYERVWVKDCYTNNEGFVYVYTNEKVRDLEQIKSGSWHEFRKNSSK